MFGRALGFMGPSIQAFRSAASPMLRHLTRETARRFPPMLRPTMRDLAAVTAVSVASFVVAGQFNRQKPWTIALRNSANKVCLPMSVYKFLDQPPPFLPLPLIAGIGRSVVLKWHNSDSGGKVVMSLIGANLAVFGLGMLPHPGVRRLLFKAVSMPINRTPLTALTSSFMHGTPMHLLTNVWALNVIGPGVATVLGGPTFLASYITLAGFSGVISSAARCAFSRYHVASIGASGAIFGVLGMHALLNRDKQFRFILFPFYLFTVPNLLILLMCFDVYGIARGRMRFDHFGHLGGAISGLALAQSMIIAHNSRICHQPSVYDIRRREPQYVAAPELQTPTKPFEMTHIVTRGGSLEDEVEKEWRRISRT